MSEVKYLVGSVPFGYSLNSKKWEFECPGNHKFLSVAPGGKDTAAKIAKVINAAVNRAGCLDNLGRANIKQIVHKATLCQS